MDEYERALGDLQLIKGHLASGAAFQGYGPQALAATGGLAGAAWLAQSLAGAGSPAAFMAAWVAVAVASVALVGAEMVARGRRHHEGLADAMVLEAAERFLPFGATGALAGLVTWARMPDLAWLLPPLWAVLVGLGIFSAARSIPGRAWVAGAWYVLAGFGTMAATADARTLEPWMMGLPFCAGQLLLAALVRLAPGGSHGA